MFLTGEGRCFYFPWAHLGVGRAHKTSRVTRKNTCICMQTPTQHLGIVNTTVTWPQFVLKRTLPYLYVHWRVIICCQLSYFPHIAQQDLISQVHGDQQPNTHIDTNDTGISSEISSPYSFDIFALEFKDFLWNIITWSTITPQQQEWKPLHTN